MKKNKKDIIYYKYIAIAPRKIRSLQGKSAGFTIAKSDIKEYDLCKGDTVRPILRFGGKEHPIPFSKIINIGDNLGIRISKSIMSEQKLRVGTVIDVTLHKPCYEYSNDATECGKKFVFILEKREGIKLQQDLKSKNIEHKLLR